MSLFGWFVTPFGPSAACRVLWKKFRPASLAQAATIGADGAVMAVALDYVFLVKLLNPPDGYSERHAYQDYALTLVRPAGFARRG